jgi:Glucodextranase, domain B
VVLQKLNAGGNVVGTAGVLRDDGLEGDASAGDSTYTLRTTVLENTPGVVNYRVSANFTGYAQAVVSALLPVNVTGTATGIEIASPAGGAYLNTPVVTVSGSVGDAAAQVSINGIVTPVTNNSFAAAVPLNEGPNTVTAVASNSNGTTSTRSILITLDTTPPRIQIYSPGVAGSTTAPTVTVTGLINDIVVGTVNPQQATVTVNGVNASVVNRSFQANNVPLNLGSNTVQAVATDRAGNFATASVQLTRVAASGQASLSLVSGNNQSAAAGANLPAALVTKLVDGQGQPLAGRPVVFRILSQDGSLSAQAGAQGGGAGGSLSAVAINTDTEGLARAYLRLGSRAGAGNNLVEASATGVASTADFAASATAGTPSLMVVDSGNNQLGVVGQPLPFPFIAIVTDANNNRLPNVPVIFEVKSGNGSFAGSGAGSSTLQTTSDSDGRVSVTLTLGPDQGVNNNVVEALLPGSSAFPAAFAATGLVPGPAEQTRISGVVLDNSNNPMPGVTMRLLNIQQGNFSNIPQQMAPAVQTDAQGQFVMTQVPVGVFKLMADGGTTTRSGSWPTLDFDMITVSGQNNTLGMPVFLPELNPNNRVCVTESSGGTLTIAEVPGFALEIIPGSATFPGGSKTGCVSVTPVNMDKVPMSPGFGQQPRFIVTIQPAGTHFNPPARMAIPNVDGLAPRAVTEMYSYDHDLASFVAIGSATVSEDGSTITSDVGSGVIKAGWHCGGNPNATGSAGTCPTCKKCQGSSCVADNGQTPPQASPTDCKEQFCSGGAVANRNKDTEEPTDVCKECKNGLPTNVADWTKPRQSTDRCEICKAGSRFTLPRHTDNYDDLAKCPDGTLQDDTVAFSIDGCTNSPDSLEVWDNFPFAINYDLYVTNPIWGTVLGTIPRAQGAGQTLACNAHDVCYQTCGSNKGTCDAALGATITASCDIGYPAACPHATQAQCTEYQEEYNSCRGIGPVYLDGVSIGGLGAYQQRQRENCFCCRPQN